MRYLVNAFFYWIAVELSDNEINTDCAKEPVLHNRSYEIVENLRSEVRQCSDGRML